MDYEPPEPAGVGGGEGELVIEAVADDRGADIVSGWTECGDDFVQRRDDGFGGECEWRDQSVYVFAGWDNVPIELAVYGWGWDLHGEREGR